MDLKDLEKDRQTQQQEEDEFIKAILPEIQKEIDAVVTKHGVLLEPHLMISDMGIKAGIRIRKKVEDNPYKRP